MYIRVLGTEYMLYIITLYLLHTCTLSTEYWVDAIYYYSIPLTYMYIRVHGTEYMLYIITSYLLHTCPLEY